MKRADLRIGNLVEYENTYHTINQIRIERIFTRHHAQNKCECDYAHVIEELKPIPLTEEWLIKFGFSNIKEQTLNVKTFCKTFRIGKCTEQQTLFVELGSRGWTFIRVGYPLYNYVHQLQNLYFALTNEELIYTP